MKLFRRIAGWLRAERAGSPEDLEAAREGARIREEMEQIRLSNLSGTAAENYQTGRGPKR
jgi:hypothetical protein